MEESPLHKVLYEELTAKIIALFDKVGTAWSSFLGLFLAEVEITSSLIKYSLQQSFFRLPGCPRK